LVAAEEATKSGKQVRILSHIQFDKATHFPAEIEVRPIFPQGLKDGFQAEYGAARLWLSRHELFGPASRLAGRLARKVGLTRKPNDEQLLLARAAAEWRITAKVLRQIEWTSEETVFFPNLTWAQAVAFAREKSESRLPPLRWHGLLRFDPPVLTTGIEAMRTAFLNCGDAVEWWSDTEALGNAYSEITQRPFSVAKIPVHEAEIRAALNTQPPQRVGVGYFGESRLEKGFTHIPSTVAKVLRRDQAVEFNIQLMLPPGASDDLLATESELRALSSPSVNIIEGPLDSADLARAMAKSQVCLLPYNASAYRLRSSGLLVNAILMDRVIVAPSGENWLHYELQLQGADFVTIDDDADLADAVVEAIALARSRPRARQPVVMKSQVGRRAPWLAH